MEKSVIVKICEIPYSSHFWMLGKVILVYNTWYILYNSVYKGLGWFEKYWQRFKEIFLKMRRSTPQISMFWSSYGLGTIRFGFLDPTELPPPTLKNARYMVFHIFSLSSFLPWIFKVLNVFLGCSGGFQGQGIHWQQLRSFPKLINASFPMCSS